MGLSHWKFHFQKQTSFFQMSRYNIQCEVKCVVANERALKVSILTDWLVSPFCHPQASKSSQDTGESHIWGAKQRLGSKVCHFRHTVDYCPPVWSQCTFAFLQNTVNIFILYHEWYFKLLKCNCWWLQFHQILNIFYI